MEPITSNDSSGLIQLPTNIDAERLLLGALIQDGSIFDELVNILGSQLEPEEFASESHRIIFKKMTEIAAGTSPGAGSPTPNNNYDFSPVLLCSHLNNEGLLEEIGGKRYITSLLGNTNSPLSAVGEYAHIIRNCYKRRMLIKTCENIIEMCYTPEGRSIAQIFENTEASITKITSSIAANNPPRSAVEIAAALLDRLSDQSEDEDSLKGTATGFIELDKITQGLRPGSLNIIAARPAVGKTSFAMNIVANIAMNPKTNYPALVFSLEMPAEQLIMRLLSSIARVSTDNLVKFTMNHATWVKIISSLRLLNRECVINRNGIEETKNVDFLFIDDSSDISPTEVRAKALKLKQDYGGISCIMIDYIQLMRSSTKHPSRTLEIGEISRSLKILAKELDIPIIALAQLNREVDSRKDHRPLNSDLRESGSIEQDADLILFLLREAVYGKTEDNENEALLIIGKNRHGATADIELTFLGECTTFFDKGYAIANNLIGGGTTYSTQVNQAAPAPQGAAPQNAAPAPANGQNNDDIPAY